MQEKESKSNSHFWFSMAKSAFRIIAAVALLFKDFEFASSAFIVAEILGIIEEF